MWACGNRVVVVTDGVNVEVVTVTSGVGTSLVVMTTALTNINRVSVVRGVVLTDTVVVVTN